MAVLEFGINIGMKNLLEIKYYSSSDKVFDPNIRAKFLTGLKSYVTEVYDDKINVIAFSGFEIVCYFKMIQSPDELDKKPEPLLSYAIIEKGTDPDFVKQHLKEIISYFLERYPTNDIFSKDPKYFTKSEARIGEILGDLRFKVGDRIKSVFGI